MWLTATYYGSPHGSHKTSSSLPINGYLIHISSVCFSCGLIEGSLSLSSIGTDHVASVPVFCCPSRVHLFSSTALHCRSVSGTLGWANRKAVCCCCWLPCHCFTTRSIGSTYEPRDTTAAAAKWLVLYWSNYSSSLNKQTQKSKNQTILNKVI